MSLLKTTQNFNSCISFEQFALISLLGYSKGNINKSDSKNIIVYKPCPRKSFRHFAFRDYTEL